MINIAVQKKNGSYVSFCSKGHAGFAEEGEDIICAAVSVLVINTANALEKFTQDPPHLEEKDGYVRFTFPAGPLSREAMLLMDTLVLGLEDISGTYGKKYVKVQIQEVD